MVNTLDKIYVVSIFEKAIVFFIQIWPFESQGITLEGEDDNELP
jgi:hypothetical protein